MNKKRLFSGLLATGFAAFCTYEIKATEFQISPKAPPHIQALLQKAKERVAAEKVETPRHVESRVLKVPALSEKKLYTFSPEYETMPEATTPELTPEEMDKKIQQEAELAVLEAQLDIKKKQQAAALAQMAQTELAFDSLKDTLNKGVPKPPIPESLPELPLGMTIPEPPEVQEPQPNAFDGVPAERKIAEVSESPALAEPELITWDDSQEELVAFQDAEEALVADRIEKEVSIPPLPKERPNYRFLFSQDKVTLEVEGLTFEIRIIGDSISIQEVP